MLLNIKINYHVCQFKNLLNICSFKDQECQCQEPLEIIAWDMRDVRVMAIVGIGELDMVLIGILLLHNT